MTDGPACAACLAGGAVPAFVAGDYWMRLAPGPWRFHRCIGCGSVLLHPQPDDGTLLRAYGDSYAPCVHRQGIAALLIEGLARTEARALVAVADRDSALLDLGCGAGRFLERLRLAGWRGEMTGLELNERVAAETAGRMGIEVVVGSVENAALADGSFGLVVLRHVIEHVRDPYAVLANVARALRPGGVTYVATPDASCVAARAFGRYWHGYDPPRHLHAFTAAGMRTLVRRAGLDVVEERWDFAPQMWSGSLRHALDPDGTHPGRRRFASDLNPLVAVLAALAGSVEWALRRTTMYGITARKAA